MITCVCNNQCIIISGSYLTMKNLKLVRITLVSAWLAGWIPAFAGMTEKSNGMTVKSTGMTEKSNGMTEAMRSHDVKNWFS